MNKLQKTLQAIAVVSVCQFVLFSSQASGQSSVTTSESIVVPAAAFGGILTDANGLKRPQWSNVLFINVDHVGLSPDQVESIQLQLGASNRKTFSNFIKMSFPELDANDPDAMEKVKDLKLSNAEYQNRMSMNQLYGQQFNHQIDRETLQDVLPILSRDQKSRFREVMVNTVFTGMSWNDLFAGAEQIEGFNLSEKESAAFRKAAAQIQRDMQQEMVRIQNEAWEKLMSKLPPTEREKLDRYLLIDELDR